MSTRANCWARKSREASKIWTSRRSWLRVLSRRAIGLGPDPAFNFVVTPVEDDNGEVLLSKCSEQQEKRNLTVSQNKDTKLCNCRHHQACSPSKPAEPRFPEESEANNVVQPDQEPEQHFGERIDQPEVNSTAAASRPPSAAPRFCSAPLRVTPSNCCFSWLPFHCGKKREHSYWKGHGGGRKEPPQNCEFNCQGQR
jgi:hypothetical protein